MEQAEDEVKKQAGIRFACKLITRFIYITMQMWNE